MSALVKKEVRLLLPSFGIACLLALANVFWPDAHGVWSAFVHVLSFIACPSVVIMLALSSFGAEVSSGNFSGLLAQPVPRWKIWQTKLGLLAAALLVIGILWSAIFYFRAVPSAEFTTMGEVYDALVSAGLFGLVVFSGGLWTVLLLRQVAAAFWFTLLVPGILLTILVAIFGGQPSFDLLEGMIVTVLGVYSLAGLFFARWLFLRAQDLQWSGGAIALPEIPNLSVPFVSAGVRRAWHPRIALWRKELQLHQSQLVMALVLAGLHLGVILVRKSCNVGGSPNLAACLFSFWGLWFVMPLLVGCAAVAEERKLGTLEGQLCLPAGRRMQFTVKFLMALVLSVLFGALVPLAFEGERILPGVHFEFSLSTPYFAQTSLVWLSLANCLVSLNALLPCLTFIGLAAGIGTVAFYTSSLARNTLQTLAPAVMGVLVVWPLLILPVALRFWGWDIGRGPLIYLIGTPMVVLTLLALAFWNFQQPRPGWKLGGGNLVGFAAALILAGVVTSAVYHRFWEKFTPFEPAHGAARLSLANPPLLKSQWGTLQTRLPDGRVSLLWNIGVTDGNPLNAMLGNLKMEGFDHKFINGSNWVDAESIAGQWVGLKTDGTLWTSEKPFAARWWRTGLWEYHEDEVFHLQPFGQETNWNSFTPFVFSMLLVKNDGTLWQWGDVQFDSRHQTWPGLRAFTPRQLGTDTNWSRAFQADFQGNDRCCLQKTDGSVWRPVGNSRPAAGQPAVRPPMEQLGPGLTVQRVSRMDLDAYRGTAAIALNGFQYQVGVRNDGTFRILARQAPSAHDYEFKQIPPWLPADLQIGTGTHWLAMAGSGGKIIMLKDDGTLWLWDFPSRLPTLRNPDHFDSAIQQTVPTRLGNHSDWVAIADGDSFLSFAATRLGNHSRLVAIPYENPLVSLAADGSLWFWPVDRANLLRQARAAVDPGNPSSQFESLLDFSRKPQLLGNIFNQD